MDAPDPQFAGVEAFMSELARAGVQHVCVMPGARSTPLALSVARHSGLRGWSHVDERSGSFFALGIAKATRRPVAVVCTSGTAAANLLPAAVEAFYAHVPLLLLTADRPPELRDCGAGQTIDQIKLFGSHVKWFTEVGSAEAGQHYFRTLACAAVARARANPAGPVHLNFPFREPLMPRVAAAAESPGELDAVAARTMMHAAIASPTPASVRALADTLAANPRGLIVCGPQDAESDLAGAVAQLAAVSGYPILADPTSQLRTGQHDTSMVIDTYDALLRDDAFARRHVPDLVLRFGPMPASKALATRLRQYDGCRQLVVDCSSPWNDPTSTASEMLPWDAVALCRAVGDALPSRPVARGEDWSRSWLHAAARARSAIASHLDSFNELFEGKIFAELALLLPEGAWLYVGNSMPVRDLEAFWPAGSRSIRFLCNRGANGIDGFLSSALGAAAVSTRPVVIVTGDLGFYHDLNGLLAVKRHAVRATIILINNDGGGIFSFLPQADCGAQAEEYFFTPHGLDFRGAAEMYGCVFTRVASWEQFRAAVTTSLQAQRTHVIEVPSERRRNVELHRQVWAACARALAQG